jgi:hypothetical protein
LICYATAAWDVQLTVLSFEWSGTNLSCILYIISNLSSQWYKFLLVLWLLKTNKFINSST